MGKDRLSGRRGEKRASEGKKWLAWLTGRALLYIAGSLGRYHVSRLCLSLETTAETLVDKANSCSWWGLRIFIELIAEAKEEKLPRHRGESRVSSTLAGALSSTAAPLRHKIRSIIWSHRRVVVHIKSQNT